jgi:hypothetical protein
LLTGLCLLFFGTLVLHPTQVLYADHSDLLAMHLPMKRFLVRSWQETGEVPLWNPYSFGGMPFIHDVQVAAFYPLHGPLYLLPEEAIGAAMSWLVVFHVLIAGWCMYAYAGRRGLGGTAALVAAAGYMFAGKWLLHVLAGGHYVMTPLAWVPLVLLLLEQALQRGSLVCATWAGAVFALMVLGAHPQMTLYSAVFVGLWSFGGVWEWKGSLAKEHQSGAPALSSFRAVARWLLLGAWAALVAVALSAIQWLPGLEAAPEASRAVGVAAQHVVAVAAPAILGLVGPGWSESWEDRGGFGVLWVAAALMAASFCRGRSRFEGAVALVLLVFSLGGAVLVQGLPGFRLFQIPVRMLMLLALPVALLAGRATDALLAERALVTGLRGRGRRILRGVLFGSVVLAGCSAWSNCLSWLQVQSDRATVFDWLRQLNSQALAYWSTALLLFSVAGWLLSERCQLPRRAWGSVWLAVLLADLWGLTGPCVAVRPDADIYAPSATVISLVDKRKGTPQEHWRVFERGLPGLPSSAPLGAALPMLGPVQIEPVLGYNSFDVRRYKEFLQFIADEDYPIRPREGLFGFSVSDAFPIRNKTLLDLLGVRYLLQPRDARLDFPESGEPSRNAGWREDSDNEPSPAAYSFLAGGVQTLPPYSIFENRDAVPRAWVVHTALPLAERSQVLDQLKGTDFRCEVLLEGITSRWGLGGCLQEEGFHAAEIRAYSPNRVVLETATEAPGFLVLTDVWFPGWTCTVDSEPVDVRRADYLFRAVAVPAGSHEVVFTLAPASYRWGKLISLVSLGLLMGITGVVAISRWVTKARVSGWSTAPRFAPRLD